MNQCLRNLASFISTVTLVVVFTCNTVAQKPNVILIITDDQGYGDLSCHGNPSLKTPNMDQLYAQSVRLTNYHVAPTCSPTRAAIQTGRWSNRVGVWHTITDRCMLYEDETTLGQMFQSAGYATGMFGKWHLGDNAPYRPEDRGYSEVLRHGGGGVGQTPDYWDNAYFDDTYFRKNGKPESHQGFCTDVFFKAAQDFIKEQSNNNKPFFAYIATNAPHGPFHSPESFSKPYQEHGVGVANFLGMIANIDHNVGLFRDFLKDNDLEDNTILVFTTDNGTAAGNKIFNAGMRGQKGSEYDGGHRVPFFIRWPNGKIDGARDINRIAGHVDVFPTLLDLCGIPLANKSDLDGQSLKPLLLDQEADWPDRVLITDSQRIEHPDKWRKSCVMTDRWRLVNRSELFDMMADPSQETNVAQQHPGVVERLQKAYESWWKELQPSLKRRSHIHVGLESGEVVNLTSHDWTTGGGTPWNQAAIRRAKSSKSNIGHWNIKVLADGKYRIAVRRWPRESEAAIDAELPPGKPVPGHDAFRTVPGVKISPEKAAIKVGDSVFESSFVPESQEIDFDVDLKQGNTQLSARFILPDGSEVGAYYAYVTKLAN